MRCFKGSHVILNSLSVTWPSQNATWRFGLSRKSDVSSDRMELWIHFLLLDQQKLRLFQVDKTTIQVLEWHLIVIFCLLTNPKFVLDEVDGTIFQVLQSHFEIIYFLLANQKCYFSEVIKWCLTWSPGTANSFSSSWPASNDIWLRSRIRCFKGSHGTFNSFSTPGPAQNAT